MSISAIIPKAFVDSINAFYEEAGHGPNNFSIRLHAGQAPTTHYAFHSWNNSELVETTVLAEAEFPQLRVIYDAENDTGRFHALRESNGIVRMTEEDLT